MEHIRAFPLPPVSLVLGGARSGKSTHAERMVTGSLQGGAPQAAVYIATAQAGDVEMATRIMAHRARRGGAWTTIEEPLKLAEALQTAAAHGQPVLVDCLTLWLSNLLVDGASADDVQERLSVLLATLARRRAHVVIVSNEVGLGLVPETALGRLFRDLTGRAHQQIAAVADELYLAAMGVVLRLRPAPLELVTE